MDAGMLGTAISGINKAECSLGPTFDIWWHQTGHSPDLTNHHPDLATVWLRWDRQLTPDQLCKLLRRSRICCETQQLTSTQRSKVRHQPKAFIEFDKDSIHVFPKKWLLLQNFTCFHTNHTWGQCMETGTFLEKSLMFRFTFLFISTTLCFAELCVCSAFFRQNNMCPRIPQMPETVELKYCAHVCVCVLDWSELLTDLSDRGIRLCYCLAKTSRWMMHLNGLSCWNWRKQQLFSVFSLHGLSPLKAVLESSLGSLHDDEGEM